MNHATFLLTIAALWLTVVCGCAEYERREVSGAPFDEDKQCWGARQPTGVYTRHNSCGNTVHIAQDEAGQIWFLNSDCDVEPFDELEPSDPRLEMLHSAPQCDQLE